MAYIRRPTWILFLIMCTAVAIIVVFAPVVPPSALIELRMQKAKSEIMRFAHRYNRLPGSTAEVENTVSNSRRGLSVRGITMKTLGGDIVVLKLNGFEGTFRAKEKKEGQQQAWSPIDAPWVVQPHRLSHGGRR